MKLNNTICKNARPSETSNAPKKYNDGNGLYLYVYPDLAKRWRNHHTFNGKGQNISLGCFPVVSLKEARIANLEVRELVAKGINPVLEKRKRKLLAKQDAKNTFSKVTHDWFETKKSGWKERYRDDVIKRIEADIFPDLEHIPIKDITPPMLLQVIRKIENRGAHDLAKRQLQKCGEIFRYAISEGIIKDDPSANIHEALKPSKKGHFASIEIREIPEFISALERNDARLYQSTRNAMKLLMSTFTRTSELIHATWEEIDLDEAMWIIPTERMKMGREHYVPLSRQVISILKNQYEIAGQWPLVFPSSVRPRQSMSNNTILGALRRLGFKGRMTGHGFRSLAMSAIMEELGYRYEVPDLQLAHVKQDKIRQAYDRAQFREERIKMMQDWSDYLESKGLRCEQ